MGRLFSMLLLLAVMLCPVKEMQTGCDRSVFFSLLFPQLIPKWMLDERAEVIAL